MKLRHVLRERGKEAPIENENVGVTNIGGLHQHIWLCICERT